ncbi:Protein ssh4, variant 2 [Ascochyta rabiei]|uniref:Protein ssh4, variant 2 n=1 Tax=Didymella rabiei TaxID=5454 RepID=UPI0022055B4F|nr:Protein ssh4, variant 2 [Ascochyta rabiei]UPX16429.1 Protein ssh4, variant 2 [Ascochyta rabiei]
MLPQEPLQVVLPPTTLSKSYLPVDHAPSATPTVLADAARALHSSSRDALRNARYHDNSGLGSTAKGIMIGVFSVLGAAGFCFLVFAIVYYFRYTQQGRIFLDRIARPGEYDDEQQFAKEEAEALEDMDDLQAAEYLRAKAFVQVNPPESVQTDISLSQFLAIQEKGVSAWEFEPELEIANCFVEGRTEIEFFDSECSVQSNLPIPKQNEVYYWEAKIYEKPENTSIAIGVTTKPYPLFRLPGYHKSSISYGSNGNRRYNQPFTPSAYGPAYVQGDVIGVGYRPRTGTVFFTRNGKKLDDVAHGLKTQNFFPTVGAQGPCQVHVNFGQMGFVFIEANVKKWGLAPQTGSLAPPPPYGSEQGSILLDSGRDGIREGMAGNYISAGYGHARSSSQQVRLGPFSLVDSNEDIGEGTSAEASNVHDVAHETARGLGFLQPGEFPPEYTSPLGSPNLEAGRRMRDYWEEREQAPLLQNQQEEPGSARPLPSYDAAVAAAPHIRPPTIRVRSSTQTSRTPRGGPR